MFLSGKIVKLYPEFNCGFFIDSRCRSVYFSKRTTFRNMPYKQLKLGDSIRCRAMKTPRGLFAQSLSVDPALLLERVFLQKKCISA